MPPMGIAQTQIANCHGKASQRSVFFGSLCRLSSIHISLASALVCFATLEVHQFDNKTSGLPDLPVQRSLTLIAKVIQSLANLNAVCSIWPFLFYHTNRVCIGYPERRIHAWCKVFPRRKDTRDARLYPRGIYTKSRGIFSPAIRNASSKSSCSSPSRKEAGHAGSTKRRHSPRAAFS